MGYDLATDVELENTLRTAAKLPEAPDREAMADELGLPLQDPFGARDNVVPFPQADEAEDELDEREDERDAREGQRDNREDRRDVRKAGQELGAAFLAGMNEVLNSREW